jgi:hypothetical protein
MDEILSTLIFESPETIKAIQTADGKTTVGAYAIRFSDATQKDLTGDFFTADTYLGAHKGDGVDVLFNHGMPPTKAFDEICGMILGAAKATADQVGVFVQHVLDLSDEYQAAIAQLCAAGKLKWSSGATSHMVKRAETGEIKRWPIAEFSYTPTPAEPRLPAISPLKSLAVSKSDAEELGKVFEKNEETEPSKEPKTTKAQVDISEKPVDDAEREKAIEAEVKARVEQFLREREEKENAVKARTREIEEIYKLGDKFGRRGEAARWIEEDKPLEDFRKFLLERLHNAKGMVALSFAAEPDTKSMKRKDFDVMNVKARMDFLKSGGRLTD